ncbi:MAG TPA: ABC transporter permease [Conexibacter sp.]
MLPPATLLHFHRKRLRVHAVQELLAGAAIAVAVALVLAFQVVNSGVRATGQQNLRALSGDATLTLVARDPRGFDARLAARVPRLPGVVRAAATLEQGASATYGGRRVQLQLVGADGAFSALHATATRRIDLGRLRPGLVLPQTVARRLGILDGARPPERLPRVALVVRGRAVSAPVTAVLDREMIGPLAGAPLAFASLSFAQRLTGLPGRATRILAVPQAGREPLARAELERLAGGRLTVTSRDEELRALALATAPIDDAATLLTAVGALVGLLLAFTATLPTLAERRRFVAVLRMLGCPPGHVVQIVAFQALALGECASAAGVLLGLLVAHGPDHDLTGYLGSAFPLGSERTPQWQAIAATFAGGVLASCLAAALPLLELRANSTPGVALARPRTPGRARGSSVRLLAACGLALLVAAGSALLLEPATTLVGVIATAVAIALAVPAAFAVLLRMSQEPARRWRLSSLALALRALRATSLLALGLAAAGAVAVFGAIGELGGHANILHGMYASFRGSIGTADVWIAQPGDDLALRPFDARDLVRRVAAVDGVRDVRSFHGGLLDVGVRRVWLVARPPGDRPPVPPSQIVDGDAQTLERRLRATGWVAVSQQLAAAQGAGVGQRILLPTPRGPATFRVAALTTNLGWGPGAVVMSARDHRRAWGGGDPSALEVDLDRGVDAAVAARAIRRALGPDAAGLQVETARARIARACAVARDGLAWGVRAAWLLLVAAVLAMTAAIGAGAWQRRAAFGQLRLMGWRSLRLWCALLWEAALVLGTGCLVGAAAGVYAQLLGDRWLRRVIDYPTSHAIAPGPTAITCLLVFALALVATAVPGALMSRTPPHAGGDPSA